MIDGYTQSGQIETARRLFDQMQEKKCRLMDFNGYVLSCLFKEALELFQDMQVRRVEPDKVMLACALSVCGTAWRSGPKGQWIHTCIKRKRIQLHQVLGCVLVDMYAKCGELTEVVAIFKKIESKRSVSLWTAMITGFAVRSQGRQAVDLFEDMEEKGIRPNELTFTGILAACSYSGLVE